MNALDRVAFQDDGGKVEGGVRCEEVLEVAINLPVGRHVVGEQADRVGDLIEAMVAERRIGSSPGRIGDLGVGYRVIADGDGA